MRGGKALLDNSILSATPQQRPTETHLPHRLDPGRVKAVGKQPDGGAPSGVLRQGWENAQVVASDDILSNESRCLGLLAKAVGDSPELIGKGYCASHFHLVVVLPLLECVTHDRRIDRST